MSERLVALDPDERAAAADEQRTLARRPDRLDGAVVGLVVNGLGRAEDFLDASCTTSSRPRRPSSPRCPSSRAACRFPPTRATGPG